MATPVIDVYVKLPSGRTSTINLLPSDKVYKILEHLATEEGVPKTRVRLKYQGKVLDKNKTIGYLGVCAETILKGEVIVPKDITLYAKFKDGRCVPIKVQNVDTLSTVKCSISESGDVPTGSQSLKFGGRALTSESDALFELGINDESVIEVSEKDITETKPSEQNHTVEASEELKGAVLSSFDTGGRNVEVVFCFDTTGSMHSYLNEVRSKLKDCCTRLLRDIHTIRIGIMAHGDYCDYYNYVTKYIDLTADVDELVTFANDVSTTGGGDTPECYEWALKKAQQLDWSEDSAKALVVIGDCEPHPPSYTDQNVDWHAELDVLKGMGVKVYGVHCVRNFTQAENFYAELAEQTGGCFLKLTHFNLITDMFLAVCYREADPEQLDAFTEELEQEGRLTEDTRAIMTQLEETQDVKDKKKKDKPKRYVDAAWWDFTKDKGNPQYTYIQDEDKWRPISHTMQSTETGSVGSTTGTTTVSASGKSIEYRVKKEEYRVKKKRGCTVM